jgi:hypothetical protein
VGAIFVTVACEIVSHRGAVFSVWGAPTVEDVDRVLAAVAQAAATYGGPIVYVTRVPPQAPAPEGPVRRHIDAVLPEMTRHCSSYHVVLEGAGFIASVKRSVLTNLLQPIWKRRKFYVHADVKEVRGHIEDGEQANVTALFAKAQRLNLLTCAPPGQPARLRHSSAG